MNIDPQTFGLIFALLIVLAALLVWKSLRRLTTASENAYDWQDLLMENGRASKAAHVMMGSYAVTTWYFVYAAVTGKMTDILFAAYGALWIAPVVARLIWNPNMPSAPTATATTTTTLTTP